MVTLDIDIIVYDDLILRSGYPVKSDKGIDEVTSHDLDVLIIPGRT